MFACLYLPPPASRGRGDAIGRVPDASDEGRRSLPAADLIQLARDFSPRVEPCGHRLVTLDVSGLGSLLGDARAIGEELRRTAADRGLRVHIAIAATSTAARLLATSHAGLVVISPGDEARALAPLPLSAFASGLAAGEAADQLLETFRRWGLRTLGDLAAVPAADLSARLGQQGLIWQQWARGEEGRPLVPAVVQEPFEATLDLEWPIEGLEPLSFVLARLFDPLCERLEQEDRGAVVLHVTLTLVTSARYERSLQLPAPMRDPRVLRTLALLDLESHPPPAGIDRVRVAVEVTEGRVLQFGLFARALPTERLATLLARLGALMGSERVGAPALEDSYRPGAFAMAAFEPQAAPSRSSGKRNRLPTREPDRPVQALRRFRFPIPARVALEQGRPVRVTTDRRGFAGGAVEQCQGPWRSSGEWWAPYAKGTPAGKLGAPWNCDEWDVTLADGASYRISQTLPERVQWFVNGILD